MQLQVLGLNYKTAPIDIREKFSFSKETIRQALEFISKYRAEIQPQLPTHQARIKFWREVLTPEIWQIIKRGDLKNLEAKIKNAVTSAGLKL